MEQTEAPFVAGVRVEEVAGDIARGNEAFLAVVESEPCAEVLASEGRG